MDAGAILEADRDWVREPSLGGDRLGLGARATLGGVGIGCGKVRPDCDGGRRASVVRRRRGRDGWAPEWKPVLGGVGVGVERVKVADGVLQ